MALKAMGTVLKSAIFAGLVLAGAAPGSAMGTEPKKAKANDPSKRVCHTIRPTGTRMVQRICRTQQEWDESAKATQDSLLAHQRKNTATNGLTSFHAGSSD